MIYSFIIKLRGSLQKLGIVTIPFPFSGDVGKNLYVKTDDDYYLVLDIVYYNDPNNNQSSGVTQIIGELIVTNNYDTQINQIND